MGGVLPLSREAVGVFYSPSPARAIKLFRGGLCDVMAKEVEPPAQPKSEFELQSRYHVDFSTLTLGESYDLLFILPIVG